MVTFLLHKIIHTKNTCNCSSANSLTNTICVAYIWYVIVRCSNQCDVYAIIIAHPPESTIHSRNHPNVCKKYRQVTAIYLNKQSEHNPQNTWWKHRIYYTDESETTHTKHFVLKYATWLNSTTSTRWYDIHIIYTNRNRTSKQA